MIGLLFMGCATDAYLQRQTELCHPVLGCVERPFWRDADEDGWGDPAEMERFRWPPEGESWVDNPRDCDDSDPAVRARLGFSCLTGVGHVDDSREYLFVDTAADAYEASALCGDSGFAGVPGGPMRLTDYAPAGWTGWIGVDAAALFDDWPSLPDDERPVLLDAGVPSFGEVDQAASFVCSRPLPDPRDYVVIEAPE